MRASTWGMTDLLRRATIGLPSCLIASCRSSALPTVSFRVLFRSNWSNSAIAGPALSVLQDSRQTIKAALGVSSTRTRRLAAWHLLPEHLLAATQITAPRPGKNVAGIYTRNGYIDRALRTYIIYMGASHPDTDNRNVIYDRDQTPVASPDIPTLGQFLRGRLAHMLRSVIFSIACRTCSETRGPS